MRILLPSCAIALSWLFAFVCPQQVAAHASLDQRIVEISTMMIVQPQDAALWMERSDLHRRDGHFNNALSDLDHAATLRPGWPMLALGRARIFQDEGRTADALAAVQTFLNSVTNHAEAFTLRARCRMKQHKVAEAIADYSSAIPFAPSPSPDLFLERARAQAALGQLANAIAGLDEGMTRLGDIPTLQLAAIEYERQHARFDAALGRVEKLLAKFPVKEPWLVLRGEILAQAGRLAEAKEVFQQTLAGIENYPVTKRGLEQTIQLQTRTREALARVEARLTRKSKA
jgi:tetratricopeptide (TPR) repeat protein